MLRNYEGTIGWNRPMTRPIHTTKKIRPGLREIQIGYLGTHECSKLRIHLSRCWAYTMLKDKDEGVWMTTNLAPTGPHAQEILVDGLNLMRNLNRDKRVGGNQLARYPARVPPCDYHQHRTDEACPCFIKKRKRDEDATWSLYLDLAYRRTMINRELVSTEDRKGSERQG